MTHRLKLRAGMVLAVVGLCWAGVGAAQAGQHAICYEGPTEWRHGLPVLKMVVGCADDRGAPCSIQPGQAHRAGWAPSLLKPDQLGLQAQQAVQSAGQFAYYEFAPSPSGASSVQKMTAQITFAGVSGVNGASQTRECQMHPAGTSAQGLSGEAVGVLTGFSTDESGLATTGVWRHTQRGSAAAARVPADFLAVGGGVEGEPGTFIDSSTFIDHTLNLRSWQAMTFTDALLAPRQTTAWVIGLNIQGLRADSHAGVHDEALPPKPGDLRALVKRLSASSTTLARGQPTPSWSVALPPRSVALGGGLNAGAEPAAGNGYTPYGQWALVTAPTQPLPWLRCVLALLPGCTPPAAHGWQAESLSELGRLPGDVSVSLALLPQLIEVAGKTWEVRGRLVQSTTKPGLAHTAQVSGLRGTHAVTGVGAALHWQRFNRWPDDVSTRITKLQPRPDIGGAEASATSTITSSVTALSTYALGIRLVDPAMPPDIEPRPEAQHLSVSWLCAAWPDMQESGLCQHAEEAILAADVCVLYPRLKDMGYCEAADKPADKPAEKRPQPRLSTVRPRS